MTTCNTMTAHETLSQLFTMDARIELQFFSVENRYTDLTLPHLLLALIAP